GRGNNHHFCTLNVRGRVPFVNYRPFRLQITHQRVPRPIRPRHGKATPQQHLGNRGNPRPADTDEVDVERGSEVSSRVSHQLYDVLRIAWCEKNGTCTTHRV